MSLNILFFIPNLKLWTFLLHIFQACMKKLQYFTCKCIFYRHTDKRILVVETWIKIIVKAREYFFSNFQCRYLGKNPKGHCSPMNWWPPAYQLQGFYQYHCSMGSTSPFLSTVLSNFTYSYFIWITYICMFISF